MINRRSILTTALTVTAAGAAAAVVTAIPAVANEGVSPRMVSLIADFVRLSAALDHADPKDWDRAAEARQPVLEELVFHRPETVIDLAAKITALSEFMADEDTELFVLRRLAEDARLLAGAN